MRLDRDDPPVLPRHADDVASLLIDPSRTRAAYGWEAQTPLAAGIRAAVDWYSQNGVQAVYTHLSMKG